MNITLWDGKPIAKAGIYSGVPMKDYHGGRLCIGPSISSSGLRTIFSKSEAHFFDTWPINPKSVKREETAHFTLGRAAHHLLLGEQFFNKEFVIRPEKAPDGREWHGSNKGCVKWLAEAAAMGLSVLSGETLEKVKGMAVALGKEPLVRAGTLNGQIECTIAWPDKETGVWLLSRPDVVPTDSGDFVDLKTSASVLFGDLMRSLGEYGYNQQGALVGEGYEKVTGQKMSSFSLYFVESARPHCCRLMEVKSDALALGVQQNRNALRRFAEAMNSGVWPGPGGLQDTVQYISIGDFHQKRIEDMLKFDTVARQ